MKILLACEESQAVCIEFRKRGHEAYSCDTQDCSGGHPEWHLKMDVFKAIKGGMLVTQSGQLICIDIWDMMIAFPPCTHLAVSGAAWFEEKRKDGRQQQGIDFFLAIANAPIHHIAIENPVGIMSKLYRKPNQVIHPYFFGDPYQKTTCLWLKNLPILCHNDRPNLFDSIVTHTSKGEFITFPSGKKMAKWYAMLRADSSRGSIRSKTFPGIAKAMAEQWG
jgi:hypothetical protein